MTSAPSTGPTKAAMDVDRLSFEIFSILESKFLFGYDDPHHRTVPLSAPAAAAAAPPVAGLCGRVRILSIDGGGLPSDALLAAASLASLETSLRRLSGDPTACVADFFDVAAGSGAGGVLAAMLFTRGHDSRPLVTASEALRLFASWSRRPPPSGPFGSRRRSALGWLLRRRPGRLLRRLFGDATLRDTVKPVLVPCYDLSTGATFLFSRAAAVEVDGYNFLIRDVCAATCADAVAAAVEMNSADGCTRIAAVGGVVAMANPAAAAITHVLNNKQEFPFAAGVDDLMVLSLGSGESWKDGNSRGRQQVPSCQLLRIAGEGAAEMVDQAISMAFGLNRANSYVRIQVNGFGSDKFALNARNIDGVISSLEQKLSYKNVESMLFRGKKVTEQSNAERLEMIAGELVEEDERRKKSLIPIVVLKQAAASRSSSALSTSVAATASSASTRTSTSRSLV